ncbi:uncharacterized protein LOC106457141 [Limulus polyphemus]|uniref:Uncharacterized protein LOC106457141 n=1 Tax=Limulus polyphemus TaxID=6850 RepID=A0ABM1B000_LIMPO|nr:uncharacterized protein LOC106457141 [Limulus polyphemus]
MSETKVESQHESSLIISQKNNENPLNDVNKSDHLGGGENMAGSNAVNEPLIKKVKLTKDTAVMETPKIDNEHFDMKNFDKERSSTQTLQDNGKAVVKGISTVTKTAKEGEALLKEIGHADEGEESQRRRTRSQTRGDPVPPPLQKKTPRQETPRRGRRGRPRKEESQLPIKNLDHHEEGSSIKECDEKKEVAPKEVNDMKKEEAREINLTAQKETSITESESLASQN